VTHDSKLLRDSTAIENSSHYWKVADPNIAIPKQAKAELMVVNGG
jgi:hypothetical protein